MDNAWSKGAYTDIFGFKTSTQLMPPPASPYVPPTIRISDDEEEVDFGVNAALENLHQSDENDFSFVSVLSTNIMFLSTSISRTYYILSTISGILEYHAQLVWRAD